MNLTHRNLKNLEKILKCLSTWDLEAMGKRNLETAKALNWTKIGKMTVAAYGLSSVNTRMARS